MDKTSYVSREKALITVSVTDGADPVDAAAVHIEITTANGKKMVDDGTTDANGVAVFEHRVNFKRDGGGTYSVVATASKDGYESGSGSTI